MAKTGAGKVASDLQSGLTPTVAETTRATLQKSIGNIVENMELPDMESEQGTSDLLADSVYSESSGFTPEGELLPLDERAELVNQNMINPEFNDWQQAPMMDNPYEAEFGPIVAEPRVNSTDEISGLMTRADTFSKNVDKLRNPEAFTVNWHTGPSVKDEYVNLNKQIATAPSLTEKLALSKKRDELLKEAPPTANNLPTILNSKLKAVVEDPNTGYTSIDPDFGRVMSIATEHAMDNGFLGALENEEEMTDWEVDEAGAIVPPKRMNPADLSARVGKEVSKWYDAERKGRGDAPIEPLSDAENKDLGAAALMAYAGAFPDIVNVDYTKGSKNPDGTVNNEGMRFELTPEGATILENNRGARNRMMGTRVEPLRSPAPGGLRGASAREKTQIRGKSDIGSKDKSYASLDSLEESIANQNGVAHVVDKRRAKIATVMLLPTLYGQQNDPNLKFSNVFGLGKVSYDTIVKEQMDIKGMSEVQAHDFAMNVMALKKKDAAREIKALMDNLGMPNYLTFGAQPMTARTMVQQTDLNPTRKKTVRFALRSKHPAVIRSMSGRLYENYMNILALSFGKDGLLSKGRIQDLKDNKALYRSWGDQLKKALNNAIPDQLFNEGAEKIATGQQLPNPTQQLIQFQNSLDPKLMLFLDKKGEDAMMAIDALIDFAEFSDNMDEGRPHKTFVNAYVDGKTNGIANQAIMLGIIKLATRVGILRSDESESALEGGDVRDAMASLITDRLNNGTIPVISNTDIPNGMDTMLRDVLMKIGQAKEINKAISMIFPYGKEIAGMKGEIAAKLPEVRANNSVLDKQITALVDKGLPLEKIIAAAHDNVVYALFDIFGEDTFKTRSIMRHVGFLHAITDGIFSIKGPTGHRINLGDKRLNPATAKMTNVTVKNTAQPVNKNMSMNLQTSEQYLSSAATRPSKRDPRGEAAGHVRGRAAVIPTQSMDAAVVIRTSTGRSWDKLKQNHPEGDPYFFQIYDAYKVDVHNYDVLVDEVNRNFMDITTRDWSFLNEAEKELKVLDESFQREMESDPTREWSLDEGGRFSYLARLMDPETSRNADGKISHYRGTAKSFVSAVFPVDPNGNFIGRTDFVKPSKTPEPAEVVKQYKKFINDKSAELQNLIIDTINSVGSRKLKYGDIPDSINSKEALAVFKAITRYSNSQRRLGALVERTNRNRQQIREAVEAQKKRTGYGALQFWAH